MQQDGLVRVDGMSNVTEGRTRDWCLRHDQEPAEPDRVESMLAGVAGRCAATTRDLEISERTKNERELRMARDSEQSRQVLEQLNAGGRQDI